MNARVLVIEDDDNVRSNIADTLELENLTVYTAADGESGVQMAHETLPDIIICDMQMPRKDGQAVLVDLQSTQDTANIPFIFLTALSDRSSMRIGMLAGADDYLTKPFSSSELVNVIQIRLKKRALVEDIYATRAKDLSDSLLKTLPHELRTPLVGIITGTEMLLAEPGIFNEEQNKSMLQLILRSGHRLQHLIENYLMLSQLKIISADAERQAHLKQMQAMCPGMTIYDTAYKKALHYGRERDLVLQIDDGGRQLQISNDYLKKIVEELVDNAFKFSSPGNLVFVTMPLSDSRIALTVRDEGRGMSRQEIDQIEAFVQFDRESYEQQGGGIGLTIVKELTRLHDGEFRISSQCGQGTTVTAALNTIAS